MTARLHTHAVDVIGKCSSGSLLSLYRSILSYQMVCISSLPFCNEKSPSVWYCVWTRLIVFNLMHDYVTISHLRTIKNMKFYWCKRRRIAAGYAAAVQTYPKISWTLHYLFTARCWEHLQLHLQFSSTASHHDTSLILLHGILYSLLHPLLFSALIPMYAYRNHFVLMNVFYDGTRSGEVVGSASVISELNPCVIKASELGISAYSRNCQASSVIPR